jgi:dUTP pyrophosphatase
VIQVRPDIPSDGKELYELSYRRDFFVKAGCSDIKDANGIPLDSYPFDEETKANLVRQIKLPERSTTYSAGYDFFVNMVEVFRSLEQGFIVRPSTIYVYPRKTVYINSGIGVYLPPNECLLLMIRSNLADKGLRLVQGTSVIDADYEGSITLALENTSSNKSIAIEHGDKIVQGVFVKYGITDSDARLSNPIERTGGRGSTGR